MYTAAFIHLEGYSFIPDLLDTVYILYGAKERVSLVERVFDGFLEEIALVEPKST